MKLTRLVCTSDKINNSKSVSIEHDGQVYEFFLRAPSNKDQEDASKLAGGRTDFIDGKVKVNSPVASLLMAHLAIRLVRDVDTQAPIFELPDAAIIADAPDGSLYAKLTDIVAKAMKEAQNAGKSFGVSTKPVGPDGLPSTDSLTS